MSRQWPGYVIAEVSGAGLGSLSLKFCPGTIKSGDYCFEIGTAGSVSLLLQTIFFPLSFVKGHSSVTIRGGTHVPIQSLSALPQGTMAFLPE